MASSTTGALLRGGCALLWRVMLAVLSMVALLPASVARAQGAPRPLGGAADLGYVAASGNTRTTTFTLGQNLTWRAKPRLVVRQRLRSIYGEASGAVNASLFDLDLSGDYALFSGVGVTIGTGFDRNRFSGIAGRYEQSVGFSWRFTSASNDSVRFTAGALWTQQRTTSQLRREFFAFRASFAYRHTIGVGAQFQESMEVIPNIENREDWRFNSETAVVAPITRKLGLKTSYVLRFANLPVPTFKPTDQIVTAGFQVQF